MSEGNNQDAAGDPRSSGSAPTDRGNGDTPEAQQPAWFMNLSSTPPSGALPEPTSSAPSPPTHSPPPASGGFARPPEGLSAAPLPGAPLAAPAEPAPPARSRRFRLLAAVGVLVLGLAVGGSAVWFVTSESNHPTAAEPVVPATSDPLTSPPVAGATESPGPPDEPTQLPTLETISPSPGSSDAHAALQHAARERLEQLADDGLDQVSLDGSHAAMIASKWNGIKDPLQKTASGSHVFHYSDILDEHETLVGEDNLGRTVILLRSTDYGRHATSPKGKVLYVTIAYGGFSSSDEVRDWCEERFAGLSPNERANTCVSTRLTD